MFNAMSDPQGPRDSSATRTAPRRLAAVDGIRPLLPVLGADLAGVARLTARAAGAPVGMLTVVGADWVHAVDTHNVPEDLGPAWPLPAWDLFCGEVISRGATVAVEDVAVHPRAGDLPVVRATGTRAYLGAPVRGAHGLPIGVLAVTDRAAHRWTADQIRAVEDEARLASRVVAARLAGVTAGEAPAADGFETPEFLRALLDSIDVSVLVVDAQGRVMSNEAMRRTGLPTGWSLADLADDVPYLHHADGRPMTLTETPLVRASAGERVRDAEVVVRAPDGESVLRVNGGPIIDAAGRHLGAVVVTQDVTGVRRVAGFHDCEMSVTEVLSRSGQVAEAAASVLECVCRALSADRGELWLVDPVGGTNRLTVAWPPDALPAGRGGLLTVPLIGKGRVFGSLVFHGCTPGVAGPAEKFLAGIAAQVAQYVERRRAEDLALELSRTKDEFIALAGHTLRTPLTTIVSLTELLLTAGDDLADERDELLRRVSSNADTLRTIVADLLDLAGLESGHINLSPRPLDLAHLVAEAADDLVPVALAAGVRLDPDLPSELPTVGDRTRLRQAVDNLLTNAIKYSPGGGVVRIRLSAADSVAELRVADTGLGVPEAERDRLFSRFFRGATAHERGIPGTGLGLPLTRLISELHGGTIALIDHDGPGATFVLRLPITPPGGGDEESAPPARPTG